MSSIQMVNSIVEWERRIDYEEERRKNHRNEPNVNFLAAPQPTQKEYRSLFARIFGRDKKQVPVYSTRKEKPCKDTQPC
jgi:hypothetical protein